MVKIDGKRLSVAEVRLALGGVSRQRVRQVAHLHNWQAQRVGNILLYRVQDVNAYLAIRQTKFWHKAKIIDAILGPEANTKRVPMPE